MKYKDKQNQRFTYKPIETLYSGYRFRSRLEARWAVFFDTLGVRWEYEKEGYDLEGIWYLPDFWLPDHDCFIEIKGTEPTKEEVEKAKLLSLYTGKFLYLFYGEVGIPDEELCNLFIFSPPQKRIYSRESNWNDSLIEKADPVSLALWYKLFDCAIDTELKIDHTTQKETIFFEPFNYREMRLFDATNIDWHIETAEKQIAILKQFKNLPKEHHQGLLDLFSAKEGWDVRLSPFDMIEGGGCWVECEHCHEVKINCNWTTTRNCTCPDGQTGKKPYPTPRIIAAYNAARQARFERQGGVQ